ncbi:MAG TPA: hypothetical protein VFZ41_04325 [Solirubrobacterales bacterium]
MIAAGPYILSAALLVALGLSLGFSAIRLRRRLLPSWRGAPAHLIDAIIAIALLTWLSELLGTFELLHAWTLVASSLLLAGAIAWRFSDSAASPVGGVGGGVSPQPGGFRGQGPDPHPALSLRPRKREGQGGHPTPTTGPTGPMLLGLITVGVIALVFAHWGLTTKDALDRGIFNFDSLWYHMPFAVEMAQSHSVTGLHHTETVLTNWFYPQNSELLHAVGILLTERDTLSLFLNFAWLAIAFLAAWCIGRPYGRGHLAVITAAVILECHTLVVREPGAAKNDLMAAALLLAAIAILINAWPPGGGRRSLPVCWPLAAAGLATGLAAGTKVTALAMAAALTVAVVTLAPGRRRAAAAWWLLPALAGGGFWYLRNLIAAGNPLPQVESLGPLSLPHPERLQSGRPDFSIAHYATDTGVWRDYFGPGLEQAFGVLWPLVVGGAVGGAVLALLAGGERIVRWSGAVALLGMLAYLFTPLSASGAEGAPVGFAINIRFAIPALLAGAALLALALPANDMDADGLRRDPRRRGWRWWQWALLGALLLVLAVTNRADAVLRDPDRLFGLLMATLTVLVPAALLYARRLGMQRGDVATGAAVLAIAFLTVGYFVQRDYLRDRFGPGSGLPGMQLDSAYQWARDVEDSRIGLAGTSAGFLGYGFYGTDLSNRVHYLGEEGPHGAFNAIPTCRGFREAVNAADLDYLVTAPFLNFIHPDEPISSPEAGWMRGEDGVEPVDRSDPVTVWRVRGALDPTACGPANAPLRRIPQQSSS